MIAVVAVETLLLVLLLVLVVGLLRSHAEILRRLGPADEAEPGEAERREGAAGIAQPSAVSRATTAAPAVLGATPGGDAVSLSFDGGGQGPTLLAFLSSGCSTCIGFWETLGEPRLPVGVRKLIITRGSERERPARLRELSPEGVPVVMSSAAWDDYEIPGAPYFVLVDGEIRGEGVATSWQALSSLVTDAIEDQRQAAARTGGIDETFAAAGIGPDHPSLYPAGKDGA